MANASLLAHSMGQHNSGSQVVYKELTRLRGHHDSVNSVGFSPDGKYILTGSSDTTVGLWGLSKGKELTTFFGHTDAVNSVAFSPNGKYILTGSLYTPVRFWDLLGGVYLSSFLGHT